MSTTASATTPTPTQTRRPLEILTPLGRDALLLTGLTGQEGISQLFHFHLSLLADNRKEVPFDRLLGQSVTVRLDTPDGQCRFFNGICYRFSQGRRGTHFTAYQMEVVPRLWLLTRRAQSRIFQHLPVPAILQKVLAGLDVSFEIQGTFNPRDYCVQYRETDFNFASRLMEEEGIYYFFKHSPGGHTLVLANTPQSHPDMPLESKIIYEEVFGGHRAEDRIFEWNKVQELRSSKCTLWDHCFELPYKHLEAERLIPENVAVGQVTHKLRVPLDPQREIYDYPGEYAQRFDGVTAGGGEQPAEVAKIFQDNQRTVGIRMQQEAVPGLVLQGTSNCRQFVTGYKFTLDRHFNANGPYVLTTLTHFASQGADYRSDQDQVFQYHNQFTCIPFGVPYRPQRVTPRPFVQGTQTAVVVGPPGAEIFTDKYGRVKVQFPWDRQGQHNADSSCWVRVTQPWAGKRWGASFWPRIGQEVIVDFLEGDPDRPIITGTVYNADQMPPYQGNGPDGKHPNDNKLCGVKSNSTPGGAGFNEWRFDDTKGKEQIFVHAEKDQDVRVKNDRREWVGHDRSLIVLHDKMEHVENDKHIHVDQNHVEKIDQNMELAVGQNQDIDVGQTKKESIGQDSHLTVGSNLNQQVGSSYSLKVGSDQKVGVGSGYSISVGKDLTESVGKSRTAQVGMSNNVVVGMNHAVQAGEQIGMTAGMMVVIQAGMRLTIQAPGGFIDIGPGGVTIQGKIVKINSGGSPGEAAPAVPGSPSSPTAAEKAKKAQPKDPDVADDSVSGSKSVPPAWS